MYNANYNVEVKGSDFNIIVNELSDVLNYFHANNMNTVSREGMTDIYQKLHCIELRLNKYSDKEN